MAGRPSYTRADYEDLMIYRRQGMTLAQAADRVGVSERTAYRLVKAHSRRGGKR